MLKYIPPSDRPLFFAVLAVGFLLLVTPWSYVFFPPESEFEWNGEDTLNLFTAALVLSTVLLWWATKAAAQRADTTIQTAERAYVKMSHVPPGINFADSGDLGVQLQIMNFGRTPARVVDAVIKFGLLKKGSSLPEIPDYKKEAEHLASKAFLVTNDHIFITVTKNRPSAPAVPLAKIMDGSHTLVVYGYVEYEDIFKKKHHSGYARYYEPIKDDRGRYKDDDAYSQRSNLAFITGDEYNYDRPA